MTTAAYQPKPGDSVRVTRRVHGKAKFIKTGVIVEVGLPHGFTFTEDEGGNRRFVASCEQVAAMPGWTQTVEPLQHRHQSPTR